MVVLEIVGSNALYRMASMSVRHPVTSLAVCPTATNMVVAGDSRHSVVVFVSGVPAQGEGKKNGTSNSPAVLSVAGADVHSRPVTACLPVPRPGAGVPVRSAYQLPPYAVSFNRLSPVVWGSNVFTDGLHRVHAFLVLSAWLPTSDSSLLALQCAAHVAEF